MRELGKERREWRRRDSLDVFRQDSDDVHVRSVCLKPVGSSRRKEPSPSTRTCPQWVHDPVTSQWPSLQRLDMAGWLTGRCSRDQRWLLCVYILDNDRTSRPSYYVEVLLLLLLLLFLCVCVFLFVCLFCLFVVVFFWGVSDHYARCVFFLFPPSEHVFPIHSLP